MTRTAAFTKTVIAMTIFGALLWDVLFFIEPSQFPPSFWIRSRRFREGVARGALLGWMLGVVVGTVVVLALTISKRFGRVQKVSR